MPVVVRDSGRAAGTTRLPNGMRVVETRQPHATRTVQGQRVVQPVRPFRLGLNPANHESRPIVALGIHDEHLPVEVQERIRASILGGRCHSF